MQTSWCEHIDTKGQQCEHTGDAHIYRGVVHHYCHKHSRGWAIPSHYDHELALLTAPEWAY